MGCILRVTGSNLVVDDLLRATSLKPYRMDRKGEPGPLKSSRPRVRSGAHFSVSDREFSDLVGQISEAIGYLETNGPEIRRLAAFPGVESMVLDFGVEWRDVAVQYDRFPAKILELAGVLGLDLEISHWFPAEPSTSEGAGA